MNEYLIPYRTLAMPQIGYFNAAARQREKQDARDRDERLIASGQADPQQVGQRNGLFSALHPSQARIVQRRAAIHIA
jgi:hypothetical protein